MLYTSAKQLTETFNEVRSQSCIDCVTFECQVYFPGNENPKFVIFGLKGDSWINCPSVWVQVQDEQEELNGFFDLVYGTLNIPSKKIRDVHISNLVVHWGEN